MKLDVRDSRIKSSVYTLGWFFAVSWIMCCQTGNGISHKAIRSQRNGSLNPKGERRPRPCQHEYHHHEHPNATLEMPFYYNIECDLDEDESSQEEESNRVEEL